MFVAEKIVDIDTQNVELRRVPVMVNAKNAFPIIVKTLTGKTL